MSTALAVDPREAWLEERRRGIGGSDAPVVLGVSPYSSALKLYAEKIGQAPGIEETERMKWGRRLEAAVAEGYGEESGRRVILEPPFTITRHPSVSYLFATLDARQEDAKLGPGVVQIKTSEHDWVDGEPPPHQQVQLQHEMEVAGVAWGTLVALVRGNRLLHKDYELNPKFVASMKRREEAFWRRVEKREPPTPDGSEASVDALRALYPKDSGASVALGAEFLQVAADLELIKGDIKALEARKSRLENAIKAALGDATHGLLVDGSRYQWRVEPRSGYEVKPTEPRVLRHIKKKG